MTTYSRNFADLSSANPEYNAVEYRRTGHMQVAIKATEGVDYVNPDHRPWSLQSGMNWIAVVHYHFARPDLNNDPEAEADHFIAQALPLAGWWDHLVLDLERATPTGWQHDPAWSRAFDYKVQKRTRFRTILYANRSTLEQSDEWLVPGLQRVWDADWSSAPDYAPPGYHCIFRQASNGVLGPPPHFLPGVGECDVNTMDRATFDHLRTRYVR